MIGIDSGFQIMYEFVANFLFGAKFHFSRSNILFSERVTRPNRFIFSSYPWIPWNCCQSMAFLLRVSGANEVPISSHIWVLSTTFKQL